MSDLKNFVVLQSRVYEFLEQQDEATLQAIASGAVQLAVLRTDGAEAPASSTPPATRAAVDLSNVPFRDPVQTARDLPMLTSEHDRRIYLNRADLRVGELREVAKNLGLPRSGNKPKLMSLLAGHTFEPTDASVDEPKTPPPPPPDPVGGGSAPEQQDTPGEVRPSDAAPSSETAKPAVEAAAVATRLREIETEDEGAAYLRAQHLDRESLLAVAAELGLTRLDRLSQRELEKRLLKQAIGARRKFAGLRKW
ncbi:hypothetical protein [Actinophytocola sp.]|uniref:hypothetical protein n=1 Tax=Actinophytocola sp. TaxID=1872138 RepID=UPI00389B091B